MPELPEVYTIAKQMNKELVGKTIVEAEVLQKKCLNMPVSRFRNLITEKSVELVYSKGKWIFIKFRGDFYLLISFGMGGDVIYHRPGDPLEDKYRFKFVFDDKSFVHVFFSWFGYVHAADENGLKEHKMTARLGIDPLDKEFTFDKFQSMLTGRKGGIKSYLMNQHHIAGIGNVYIQDILFKAGLHPNRKICDISEDEMKMLYDAIRGHLNYAVRLGGLIYERDFYGKNGLYTYDLIGHKPGSKCHVCGTVIREIKTGSTRSYICAKCQK